MSDRPIRVLVTITIISVALRVGAALYLGNDVVALPGTADQVSYHNLALRVLNGHGFSFSTDWWPATEAGEPTAHWSYLYTLYLTVTYALFGPHPIAARVIQAIIVGAVHPYLAFQIGRRVFGMATGLVGAALSAVYAYFIYYGATLMTESFYILAVMGTLMLAIRISTSASPYQDRLKEWGLLGVSLGTAVLLRQVFLLVVPFILLWLWWTTRDSRRGSRFISCLSRPLCTLLVLAALVIPWTVRNYVAFGRFVLLNTNAGYAFFWANHPIYGTHFEPILPAEIGSYQSLIPPELRSLDEAALDQELLRRGFQFVLDAPARYLLLSLSRIPAYFMFWPAPASSRMSNLARVSSFGVCLPLMVYGLWLSAFGDRAKGYRDGVALLWLFAAVYSGIHLLSWSLVRYRLPVDAALVVLAGLAVVSLEKQLGLWTRISRWGSTLDLRLQ